MKIHALSHVLLSCMCLSATCSSAQQERLDSTCTTKMHIETKELSFTMDLSDVSLEALVNALFNAKRNHELNAGILEGARPGSSASRYQGAMQAQMHNSLMANARRLSLHGSNLTLEEALDLIYQQTRCGVFEEQGALVIEQCD